MRQSKRQSKSEPGLMRKLMDEVCARVAAEISDCADEWESGEPLGLDITPDAELLAACKQDTAMLRLIASDTARQRMMRAIERARDIDTIVRDELPPSFWALADAYEAWCAWVNNERAVPETQEGDGTYLSSLRR